MRSLVSLLVPLPDNVRNVISVRLENQQCHSSFMGAANISINLQT